MYQFTSYMNTNTFLENIIAIVFFAAVLTFGKYVERHASDMQQVAIELKQEIMNNLSETVENTALISSEL
ncbi:hypothetical protein PEPS_38190 (plasmid) [Persicobacter psychrovividus]|uniref:Uncharacterized protein n=2 Tax=Persicobacter psychrovividus TaxID=387638 RepID=A0ABM7VKL2_9BACT|nr:hypothetical protein PEPS_38190 [Persicobacter psychrovividus]